MQYCVKCKKLSEDNITVCPFCKRSRSLRQAKDSDMVFLMKTTEFEAFELEELFLNHGLLCELRAYKTGIISSVYDCTVMPTDKEIYLAYKDLNAAKIIMEKDMEDEVEEEEIDEKLTFKKVIRQVILVAGFFGAVILFVFMAMKISEILQNFI